jgi:hypothetical protein
MAHLSERRSSADLSALEQVVLKLTAAAGLKGTPQWDSIPGGANNRVFRLEVNGARALLKAYFQHPGDQRDRLGAEFNFSTFAWQHDVRCLPQPLACDPEHHLGLYEYIEGRKLHGGEIEEGMVNQALSFYQQINRHRDLPAAQMLPPGSEACFSLAEHLNCVARRLGNLKNINASTVLDRDAARFIHHDLDQAWSRVSDAVQKQAGDLGWSLDLPISPPDRCLSPSDFGFHNAILRDDRTLCFIDFEYAGWDDPAKLVCDFFCQPAVPVPLGYYARFAEAVAARASNPEMHLTRFVLLMPVYQLKWCCILLNDFLPVGRDRRRFAQDHGHSEEQKAQQLTKARQALQSLRKLGEN